MRRMDQSKPPFMWFAGIVLLVAACASPTPQAAPAIPSLQAPTIAAGEAPQAVQRITLEESKTAFDSGAAIFLDVRSADSYAASHIPGARSIPLTELEARIAELDPTQWIITYCT